MYKIAIVSFYFGKFPNYIDFFWKSVGWNKDVDFMLYTDNECGDMIPQNVYVFPMSLKEFNQRIQRKFPFKFMDKSAYDMAQLRPMFGYVFEEELKEYDFWGYCDFDIIYGHIRGIITDEILSRYDKFLSLGHFTLFRNNDEMRYLFTKRRGAALDYRKVLKSLVPISVFEEYPCGISLIAKEQGVSVYDAPIFADLDPNFYTFKKIWSYYDAEDDADDIIQYFEVEDGKLYDCVIEGNEVKRKELLYVHLIRRKMAIDVSGNGNRYFIVPNRFTDEALTTDQIKDICDIRKNGEYACKRAETSFASINEKRWRKLFKKGFLKWYFYKKYYWFMAEKVYGITAYKSGGAVRLRFRDKCKIIMGGRE